MIVHCIRIANVHVRNAGSIGGNLALAKCKGFVSDLATVLLGARATATLVSKGNNQKTISMEEFLSTPNWNESILLSITIPFVAENQIYNTYKTAIRPVNSHAIINSAFLVTIEEQEGNKKINNITLAFGGVQEADKIGSHPILAVKTQEFLKDKIINEENLQKSLEILNEELNVEGNYKNETRKKLISGFYYKFITSLISVSDRLKSASVDLFKTRPLNKGFQKFDDRSNDNNRPVSLPVPKLTGKSFAAGNAIFIDDISATDKNKQLFGALVTSTIASGKIKSINPSKALQIDGVYDFISVNDIPGENNMSSMEKYPIFIGENENISYYGQPIGVIVADTLKHAELACKLVEISYENIQSPIINLKEISNDQLISDQSIRYSNFKTENEFDDKISQSSNQLSGSIYLGSQKHFYMETQVCDVKIDENNNYIVNSAGQYPHGCHTALAKVLNVSQNKIRLISRRAGGGFGGKLTHNVLIACIGLISSYKTQKNIRISLNRNVDMRIAGGREETLVDYNVGFDNTGKIESLKMKSKLSSGSQIDLSFFCNGAFASSFSQVYKLPNYYIESQLYKTNQSPRTAVRAPSEVSSSYCMETILEHIATSLSNNNNNNNTDDRNFQENFDLINKIREINFFNDDDLKNKTKLPNGFELFDFTIPKLFNSISVEINENEKIKAIHQFNLDNKFKKRGYSKVPMRYEVHVTVREALLNIYSDGSIIVHHGTSDIGQGANTKVMQVVINCFNKFLKANQIDDEISLDIIQSAELDSNILPNVTFTGGSTSSESSCEAAQKAAEKLIENSLNEAIKKIKEANEKKQSNDDKTPLNWKNIVSKANGSGLNLSAIGYCDGGHGYQNYGAAYSEIELDILTGEVEILSTYLFYDCGKSLNPSIDIGQAEGAFVMGIGFLLREEVSFDHLGKLINDGTWEYKPPSFRDIPQHFHVEFLHDTPYEKGYLSSKASGEPPLVLANSVAFAVRYAIRAARIENGLSDDFFTLDVPLTVDVIQEACGNPTFSL